MLCSKLPFEGGLSEEADGKGIKETGWLCILPDRMVKALVHR